MHYYIIYISIITLFYLCRPYVRFISVINQLDAQNFCFTINLFHVSRTRVHHQVVKIALHSLWYHHTYRWPARARDSHV